jgi:hypothetical protein
MGQTGQRSIATYILAVKIALAAAPFSWLRGGPPRAMDHLGEDKSSKRKNRGCQEPPALSHLALELVVLVVAFVTPRGRTCS